MNNLNTIVISIIVILFFLLLGCISELALEGEVALDVIEEGASAFELEDALMSACEREFLVSE